MLDKETRDRLADYFDASDLIELLGVSASDVIDAFEVEVEEALDDLEDIMGVSDGD